MSRVCVMWIVAALCCAACGKDQPAATPQAPAVTASAVDASADAASKEAANTHYVPTKGPFTLKPLTSPIVEGVTLPFDHHTVLDLGRKGGGDLRDRNVIVEVVGQPFEQAVEALGAKLTTAGFTERERRQVNDQLLRGYTRAGADGKIQQVALRGRPYKPDKPGKAPHSTGTLQISVRHIDPAQLKPAPPAPPSP